MPASKALTGRTKIFVVVAAALANAEIRVYSLDDRLLLTTKANTEGSCPLEVAALAAGEDLLTLGRKHTKLTIQLSESRSVVDHNPDDSRSVVRREIVSLEVRDNGKQRPRRPLAFFVRTLPFRRLCNPPQIAVLTSYYQPITPILLSSNTPCDNSPY